MNANGTIEQLSVNAAQNVCTEDKSIVLRFGLIKITVTATVGEEIFNLIRYGLVLGRLVLTTDIVQRLKPHYF